MIHLDTSLLVDALAGRRRSAPLLARATEQGERMSLSTLVLYEWLRRPPTRTEVADQESLFPAATAAPFRAAEALIAARLYHEVPGARHRELDLGIAACALAQGAQLWTLNPADFRDMPGLLLYAPSAH